MTKDNTQAFVTLIPVKLTPEQERLEEVALWLEQDSEYKGVSGFDMEDWVDVETACGTTCCIGGAIIEFNREAAQKIRQRLLDGNLFDNEETIAAELAGLNEFTAHSLFFPFGILGGWQATREQGAKVIRHLLATGEVDWAKAIGEHL